MRRNSAAHPRPPLKKRGLAFVLILGSWEVTQVLGVSVIHCEPFGQPAKSINQCCLCNKAPIKPQVLKLRWASSVGNSPCALPHVNIRWGMHPEDNGSFTFGTLSHSALSLPLAEFCHHFPIIDTVSIVSF